MVEIRVLGPVQLVGDDGPVALGAAKVRRLLAAFVVRAGETLPSDSLIDAVWGASPPASARKLLQVYVSQLRKLLDSGVRIETLGSGYALQVDDGSLDAARFERLVADARVAASEENPTLAASLLRRALGLWRGPAYGEFSYEEFALGEAERLEELRLIALEQRIEAELALGRHTELLAELRSLAATHWLRERLQAQAMLALYRCGRQSEALDLYTARRGRLREELGLEPGAELRDLQRRILQHDPELAAEVAPIAVSSLPTPPNPLRGRERELAELRELLLRDDLRLLVLTGAGGSGKTRLALEAARATAGAFANGSVFVGLAALRDPTLVIAAIAEACGVRKVPGEEQAVALTAALSSRELLLLIDNVEHLQAAAPSFVELLARAPRIKLLVTSRTVLHLSGERVYPVQPLTIEAGSALFCERAREVDPRFDPEAIDAQAIGRICERLDGLPLAIELAAARTSLLSPAQLLARLDPRLPMLAGGLRDLPARQQTLRATIEWSYDLLSRTQRRLFRRLAVFAGSFDLTAAERVCDAELDTLGSLVDHNLVRRSSNGRLAMLETIREFALEALERSGETDAVRDRHAQFFLGLARSADLSETAEGEPRHDLVTAEQDNIRAALGWTLDSDKVQLGVELATALELFWVTNSPLEGLRWLERLSAQAPYLPPETRASMLRAQAAATEAHGDFAGAETLYEQSLAAYRAIGDEREIAGALHGLAARARERGDLPRARELANQSLDKHRAAGNVKGECIALAILGDVECDAGDFGLGIQLLQRAAAMAGDAHFAWWQGHCLAELCERALELGRIADAETWGRESLTLLHQVGDRRKTLLVLASLARAAAENGRLAEAGRLWGAFEAEEARSPLSWWQLAPEQRYSREFYTAPVLAHSSPDFDRGRDEGHRLSLDTAISYALEPNHTP